MLRACGRGDFFFFAGFDLAWCSGAGLWRFWRRWFSLQVIFLAIVLILTRYGQEDRFKVGLFFLYAGDANAAFNELLVQVSHFGSGSGEHEADLVA